MLGAAAIVASLLLQQPNDDRRLVSAKELPNGQCEVTIDGRRFDPQQDEAQLDSFVAALPDKNRPFRFDGDEQLPYRCIGALVFAMQRHKVGRLGIISEPAADAAK